MTIEIDHITQAYDIPHGAPLTVLDDINLFIKEGDFIIILGQSGCGKSTLLDLIAGLTCPSKGEIRIHGVKVTSPHPRTFTVFQEPELLPWLNVEENIAFGCRLRGETADLAYRVNEFIEIIGLSGFERHRPNELSVGMQLRVSLARALIGRPKILLMDEPFGSLDTFTRSHLQEELTNIWLSEKFTVVFVTHDIDEAILLGTKIVLLGGRPSCIKSIEEIHFNYPRKTTDEAFFHKRRTVMQKFKECLVEKNNIG